MSDTGIITTYESGVDLVVEWKIEDFFNLPERVVKWYESPDFSFGGERWYLRIYPNGSSGRDSSGDVDLSLVKYDSGRSIKQTFSLSLKTAKGEKYNEQHGTEDFEKRWYCHSFNRFIQRSDLTRRKYELVPDGVLTVVCTMKNSTSAGSARTGSAKESARSHGYPMQGKSFENNEMGTRNLIRTLIGLTLACNSGSAECCTSDSDSDSTERSSDSDSDECCHKCSNCLDIVKKQKKLLEELECHKKRSQGAGSLCEDYKKVLLDGRHHDLILKVGDKELRAHRDILRARSRVFESMLDHDMKEKNTGIIDVPDCDPNAMELFLSYVYCGKIEALDPNNMLGLYYVADKYEMMELKRECCNFIKKSLSLTNICSVIQLALKHSDSDLLEYATGYFSDNMLDIMQTVEWQSFLKDNSTVGNELLMKSIKKMKNAQT